MPLTVLQAKAGDTENMMTETRGGQLAERLPQGEAGNSQQWVEDFIGALRTVFHEVAAGSLGLNVGPDADDAVMLHRYVRGYADARDMEMSRPLPSLQEWADWVCAGDCPPEAVLESESRAEKVLGEVCRWGQVPGGEVGKVPVMSLGSSGERRIGIGELLSRWAALPEPRPAPPLAPIVREWLTPPARVRPNVRPRRIIPANLAMALPGDRRTGQHFSPAAHVPDHADSVNVQLVLPGFSYDRTTPALPLHLYDLGCGVNHQWGPAPLPLRIFVSAVLAVPLEARKTGDRVYLDVPFRDLLSWLYPGKRRPRPSEWWPLFEEAIDALNDRASMVPWYDRALGRGGLRHVVYIDDMPRGPAQLDDHLSIVVNLPPGDGHGPQVSDNLPHWGVRSAVAYRLMLNLTFHWFNPGVTVFPVKGANKKGVWRIVRDEARYPEVSDDQLVQMAYPTGAARGRRLLVHAARQWVKKLEAEGELEVVGKKILPPPLPQRKQPARAAAATGRGLSANR